MIGWLILAAAFLCGCVATPPVGRAGIYDVRDFGARGDGAAKDTAALQAAIDAAHSAGGGEVRIHRLKSHDPVVRGLHFANISGTQGQPSYIWSRKGKPFEDISLVNVDMDKGIEAVNVKNFRLEGGTLKEIKLSPAEYEQRSADIESFRKLLY